MELDASIEPTIGPYEVYEDEWFNYKAAFEAFITLRDDAETQKLARFSGELQEIENNLPDRSQVPQPEARRAGADPRRQHRLLVGRRQPRRADRRVQPAQRRARHRREGLEARDAEEQPGGQVPDGAAADLEGRAGRRGSGATSSFDAFFTHILMHELMHGLGPHNITVNGRATTVRQEMKELSSAIEEAKADVSGSVRAAVPRRSRQAGQSVRRDDVHDLPRVDVPLDPVRDQRSARPRRGPAAQLLPRQRRREGGVGRDVHGGRAAHPPERDRPDPRHHDHPGGRGLRGGEADDREAGCRFVRPCRPSSTG